jgi:NitT/TauT family transport system substrate-binding protein
VISAALLLLFSGAEPVRVLLPEKTNLQYAAFFVAEGAGYFAESGISIERIVPRDKTDGPRAFTAGEADVAVFPPPQYLRLIEKKTPLLLVANLLANDPIQLVVRESFFTSRGVSARSPLLEKLKALRGLKLGLAPGPPVRLEALFNSVGLKSADYVEQVILPGPLQNEAFAKGQVDALYCHTPFLETARLEQGARVLVDQPGGEVPVLSDRVIHALAVRPAMMEKNRATVKMLVAAIEKAQKLLRAEPAAAAAALLKAQPKLTKERAALLVAVLGPAMPKTAAISVSGLKRAAELMPSPSEAVDLTGIDLAKFVAAP